MVLISPQKSANQRKISTFESIPFLKEILSSVYRSLQEKGYNPINQIVGYILSEDPTYITNYNNARSLIRRLDRDEAFEGRVCTSSHRKNAHKKSPSS